MYKFFATLSTFSRKSCVFFCANQILSSKLFTMKIEGSHLKSILTNEVKLLEQIFVENGYEIRIAGGAVRDLLLGILPKDLDFATTATPSEMKTMFELKKVRMVNATGEKHGTITPRINDKENFEVTTLRIDVVTDGRRAEVEFVKDWKLDANRRDLTINSMFLGLDGTVYDYFQGYQDLLQRRIVFVGDAATRIKEDYLRILRYFRFYGRIAEKSNNHDKSTLEALKNNCSGLERVSGERIWTEIHKTLEGNFRFELLELIAQLGLSPYIGLPVHCNLEELRNLSQRIESNSKAVRPITIICSLLHDANELMIFRERCKINNGDRDCGLFVIEHRDEKHDENSLKRYKIIVQSSNRPSDTRQFVEQLLLYRGDKEMLNEFKKWTIPRFPINAKMIFDSSQIEPGPMMGIVIHKLKAMWYDKDCTPTAEELLKELPSLLENLQNHKKQRTD